MVRVLSYILVPRNPSMRQRNLNDVLRRTTLTGAALLCAHLLSGCGGSDGTGQIQLMLRTGQLEEAEALLEGRGPEVDPLRNQLQRIRDQRSKLAEDIQSYREWRSREPLKELIARLDSFGKNLTDPVAKETLAMERSMAADWIAEGRPGIAPRQAIAQAGSDSGGAPWDAGSNWTLPTEAELAAQNNASAGGSYRPDLEGTVAPSATDSATVLDLEDLFEGVDLYEWPEDALERAAAAEADGAWDVAALAWLKASEAEFGEASREFGARAQAASARHAIWKRVDPEDDGVPTADGTQPYISISGVALRALAVQHELTSTERLGLAIEMWHRGAIEGARASSGVLADLETEGLFESPTLHRLVAHLRGEVLPDGGYRFHDGKWIARAQYLDKVVAPQVKRLSRRLQVTDGDKREAEYEAFQALALEFPTQQSALESALEDGRAEAAKTLSRSSNMKKLTEMHELRLELDDLRAEALELIFDTQKYFYPIPDNRRAEYDKVQREIDARTEAVRAVWNDTSTVAISDGFRKDIENVAWFHQKMGGTGHPEEAPAWVFCQVPTLKSYSVRTFALSASEADALVLDHRIWMANEAMWANAEDPPVAGAIEQVRITNRYRMLLGRPCLAWNSKIQEAADMHSEYMSRTGEFSHDEQGDPKRRTPFQRMDLVGYPMGVSENIHAGSSGPDGAHRGWTHSSGHHRNLLDQGHTEMASAVSGVYWTQNFGVGNAYLKSLPDPSPAPWRN